MRNPLPLGYIIRTDYTPARWRAVKSYKYKKTLYLKKFEESGGKPVPDEVKQFLAVRASFPGHRNHADSFNLIRKTGAHDETNPFEFDDRCPDGASRVRR